MVRLSNKTIENDKYSSKNKHSALSTLIIVETEAYEVLTKYVIDVVARRSIQ